MLPPPTEKNADGQNMFQRRGGVMLAVLQPKQGTFIVVFQVAQMTEKVRVLSSERTCIDNRG